MRRVPVPHLSLLPLPRRQPGSLLLPFAMASVYLTWYINDALNGERVSANQPPPWDSPLDVLTKWPLVTIAVILWTFLFAVLFAPSSSGKRRTGQNL